MIVRFCRVLPCQQSQSWRLCEQSQCLVSMCYWLSTTDVGCVCLVWAGDVAEEEPEEEDEQLGNLDEEEIKKMQSDEVLSLLCLFLFCGFVFFSGLTILNGD